jgi:hypothetical protein
MSWRREPGDFHSQVNQVSCAKSGRAPTVTWHCCVPRASHDLRLIKTSLAITPRPADLQWIHDVFENPVAVANFTGRTAELRFESVVTLEHIESVSPEYRLEPWPEPIRSPIRAPNARISRAAWRGATRPRMCSNGRRTFWFRPDRWTRMSLLRSMTVEIGEQFGYRIAPSAACRRQATRSSAAMGPAVILPLDDREGPVPRPGRPLRERLLRARRRSDDGRRRRRHPCVAAGIPSWSRVGRFRSDQQGHRRPNSRRRRGGVGPCAVLPLWGTFFGRPSTFLGMEVAVTVLDETRRSSEPSRAEDEFQEYSTADPAPTALRQ